MKVDKKAALPLYVLAVAAGIVVRCFQLLTAIDYSTGFYITGHPLGSVLTWVMPAGIVLFALALLFGRSDSLAGPDHVRQSSFTAPLHVLTGRLTRLFGFVCALLSSALLVDLYLTFVGMTREMSQKISTYLNFGLMLASAVVFFLIAVSVLRDGKISTGAGYSLLVPVAWLTVRSTMSFMSYILITNVSENLLELMGLLAMLLFMTLAARFLSGNEKSGTRRLLSIAGLAASLICAVSTVPRFFVLLFGPADIRAVTEMPSFSDLMLAVFAFGLVYQLLRPGFRMELPQPEEAPEVPQDDSAVLEAPLPPETDDGKPEPDGDEGAEPVRDNDSEREM